MKRGDVVIVPSPFEDRPGEKMRPALVIQSDAESRRLANTVLAMISGNLADLGQPTTVFIDPASPAGAGSGLHGKSLLKCCNLATVRQHRVVHVIGQLTGALMVQVTR
jgi:mRNA-degrading endonuclease toxin of MazEF toxin-antitoxin module